MDIDQTQETARGPLSSEPRLGWGQGRGGCEPALQEGLELEVVGVGKGFLSTPFQPCDLCTQNLIFASVKTITTKKRPARF